MAGLEEFEEKIDRIAESKGEVGDQDSWIAKIYKQFAGDYADVSQHSTIFNHYFFLSISLFSN